MGTLQSVGDLLGMGQETHTGRARQAFRAAGPGCGGRHSAVMLRVYRLGRTATDIIAMPMRGRPGNAGGLTDATADQGPQQGAWALLFREARRLFRANVAWTRSKSSWLTSAGIVGDARSRTQGRWGPDCGQGSPGDGWPSAGAGRAAHGSGRRRASRYRRGSTGAHAGRRHSSADSRAET